MPTHQQEEEFAKRMIERADKSLREVDDSFLVREQGFRYRPMPSFRPEEISLGKTLGMGGFGIVSEIKGFFLDDEDTSGIEQTMSIEDPHVVVDRESSHNRAEHSTNEEHVRDDDHNNTQDEDADNRDKELNLKNSASRPDVSDHVHYDLTKARKLMKMRVMKRGSARYAIKRLHGALSTVERARGMIDLAVEARYLSAVWHPNIIKIRGVAKGPMVDKDFFIILDRLFETLDKRINAWYKDDKKSRGVLFGIGRNKQHLQDLLIERMLIAYDIAAAMFYLHENRYVWYGATFDNRPTPLLILRFFGNATLLTRRVLNSIVYRDIKPENIGFDIRGDVKIFDFGLCKSISANLKAREGYGFRLTGRAGSLPYMAPEVVKMETYDTKCDVFSFAILLWEMLSLKKAYDGYTPSMFVEKVVMDHERLEIPKTWPPLTRLMVPEAWDKDPRKRPDMKRVAILIRADLNDLTNDDKVLHRTTHMRNRSEHSLSSLDDGIPPTS